jgi:hypothetical protein
VTRTVNMPKSTKLDRAAAARLMRPRDSVLAGFATGQATGLLDALGERTDLEESRAVYRHAPPALHPAAESGRAGDDRLPDEIAPIFAVGEPNLGTPGALVVHRSGTCEELPHLPVRPR